MLVAILKNAMRKIEKKGKNVTDRETLLQSDMFYILFCYFCSILKR